MSLRGTALLSVSIWMAGFTPAWNQALFPPVSGSVNYLEGEASLDGRPLPSPLGNAYPYLQPNSVLTTAHGRAEVLMDPGVYLRLDLNSGVRLIDGAPGGSAAQITAGSVVAEMAELNRGSGLSITVGSATAEFVKAGTVRFDAAPPRIKVLSGAVKVHIVGRKNPVGLSAGRLLELSSPNLASAKFDRLALDEFELWYRARVAAVSAASVAVARACYLYSSQPAGGCRGNWAWNRWQAIWTYLPHGMRICDPWSGYCYLSPRRVWDMDHPDNPNSSFNYDSGGNSSAISTAQSTSSGSSGVMASASGAAASSSAGASTSAAAAAASSAVGAGSAASGGHGR